jgi:hypothetical protein
MGPSITPHSAGTTLRVSEVMSLTYSLGYDSLCRVLQNESETGGTAEGQAHRAKSTDHHLQLRDYAISIVE